MTNDNLEKIENVSDLDSKKRKEYMSFAKKYAKSIGVELLLVTKEEIDAKDYSKIYKFMSRLDRAWRSYQGKILLNVDGYNHMEEELFQIPEVLAYFRELLLKNPHYLGYFSVLTDSRNLAIRFLAEKVNIVAIDSESQRALFQSLMSEQTLTNITKGILDWYGERYAKDVAITLISGISKDVEIIK